MGDLKIPRTRIRDLTTASKENGIGTQIHSLKSKIQLGKQQAFLPRLIFC